MKTVFIVTVIAILEFGSGIQNHKREISSGQEWAYPQSGKPLERKNMALVLEFYQKLFGDQEISAIDEYLGDPYIQHNPFIADGKEGLRKAVQEWLKDEPKQKLDFKRTGAEGDLVWIHLRMNLFKKDWAIMDVFRVENGIIVEHWDVMQEVPATSKNNNTMF